MDALKNFIIKYRSLLLILCLGAFLVATHIPFYFAHRVEDDAYIFFTCGKNLADTGVYGFNTGEKVSVCTSHSYVFIVALARLVFGNFFIQAVMLFNIIIFLYSLYLLSAIFFSDLKKRLLLWTFISLTPVSLLITDKGMETPLLIFLVVVILQWIYTQRANMLTYLALFFIPITRPDWAVFICLPIFLIFLKNRKLDYKILSSIALGVFSFLSFNILYFGSFLNQSIVAKSVLAPKTQITDLLYKVFFSSDYGIFLPFNISSLYIKHSILSVIFILAGIIFLVIFSYFVFKILKTASSQLKNIVVALIILIFLVPLLYTMGGFIFSWYLLPSSLFTHFLILAGIITVISGLKVPLLKRILISVGLVIILFFASCQLLVDTYGGALNYYYYSDVGNYIKNNSSKTDSIMLEPLGVIPFFAERYAHDEAGLASPLVTNYWKKYNLDWWIYYVREQKPTFLIEKDYILQYKTITGSTFSESEKKWFIENYKLVKEFHYDPADYPSVSSVNKFISRFFNMGSNSNFYIYKKN